METKTAASVIARIEKPFSLGDSERVDRRAEEVE
jgi:hypothetical protein